MGQAKHEAGVGAECPNDDFSNKVGFYVAEAINWLLRKVNLGLNRKPQFKPHRKSQGPLLKNLSFGHSAPTPASCLAWPTHE